LKETYELEVEKCKEVQEDGKKKSDHYHTMTLEKGEVRITIKQPKEFPFPVDSAVKVMIESQQTKIGEKKKDK